MNERLRLLAWQLEVITHERNQALDEPDHDHDHDHGLLTNWKGNTGQLKADTKSRRSYLVKPGKLSDALNEPARVKHYANQDREAEIFYGSLSAEDRLR